MISTATRPAQTTGPSEQPSRSCCPASSTSAHNEHDIDAATRVATGDRWVTSFPITPAPRSLPSP